MIIGRVLGYLSLCFMIMVLGAEGLRFLESGYVSLLSVADVFEFASNKQIESARVNEEWALYLSSLLNFSAFFCFLIIGLMLAFVFRKRF